MEIKFREIRLEDNEIICSIIRTVLEEYDGKREGTAYYDKDTENMFEAYQNQKGIYYVALVDGEIAGGGGINLLKNADNNTAELQKFYILSKYRGLGIGKKLVEKSIDFAKTKKYDEIYLESFPNMKAALSMYSKFGFKHIETKMGGTGHSSCDIQMLKKI